MVLEVYVPAVGSQGSHCDRSDICCDGSLVRMSLLRQVTATISVRSISWAGQKELRLSRDWGKCLHSWSVLSSITIVDNNYNYTIEFGFNYKFLCFKISIAIMQYLQNVNYNYNYNCQLQMLPLSENNENYKCKVIFV